MDIDVFRKVAESLRQYRRAELKDFAEDVGDTPVDQLYVDPLPSDAVLNTVLSSNTTFLLGRKGTGKSTVFAKAQSEIRNRNKNISVYVDVKSLYNLMRQATPPVQDIESMEISQEVYQAHTLRKSFLGAILAELIKELKNVSDDLSLWDRWLGRKRSVENIINSLEGLQERVKQGTLNSSEIPILRKISKKTKTHSQEKKGNDHNVGAGAEVADDGAVVGIDAKVAGFDETLSENEIYESYSDAVILSFPYAEILEDIKDFLDELEMTRLVIFFDDFSELTWLDQKLFVDVVLSPLNNSSDERVKLKVAGYPGRVYYGRIDPGKVDTVSLDFYDLYKSGDIKTTETKAIEYTTRLLTHRFKAFGVEISEYFASGDLGDYMRVMFQATFNVPRIMGFILHYCYEDKISAGSPITEASIRLASQKYYRKVLSKYFKRMNKFALEPFERKLDRQNQHDLLQSIVDEAKNVRKRIRYGEVGGSYFDDLSNPPVSHFAVSPALERVLEPLELNFLVTKYHEMRDKDGNDVFIYALFYGLCEAERLPWGYPSGRRKDRSYFVQRCFSYTRAIHQFLSTRQTIRCRNCGASYSMDDQEKFEFFNWKCPECRDGKCGVINLAEEHVAEITELNNEIMLEPVELDILEVLHQEDKSMRAKGISRLIDVTYQLVGQRTSKLQDLGLVDKQSPKWITWNSITERAEELYFTD